MTRRSDFTPDEWRLLQETLDQTSAVMMAAAPGGLLGEAAAAFSAVVDAADAFHDRELMQDLLGRDEETAPPGQRQAASGDRPPFEQTRGGLLLLCRAAVALLQRKATAEEVSDYRQLVLTIAEKVAAAGKEGAFLGLIGGQRVSAAEQALLAEIAAALGAGR